ncbi:hypothetical protein [Nocardia abscessus]|uniref:hypothetical protein n=1 Tax=Nocardia abscessus TaxID=120957 RepID=UPI002455060F|nr:hypothetical protein [Nocardia abscessus]
MSFPTPYTVGHHACTPGGPDPHRNPATYTPPKNQPGTPVPVIQWGVPESTEPKLAGHDRTVIVDVELFVTPEFNPNPGDLIDLPAGPAGQFEVVGYPEDANHGFHGWRPGSVVNLRRMEG